MKRDGKPVKKWDSELFESFEKKQDSFSVGLELPWTHVFFIMSAWWECYKHQDCPVSLLSVMREFEEGIERLLQVRSKRDYLSVAPYIHGAIYSGNPYMMHAMEHATRSYLWWASITGRVTLKTLAEVMECGVYGSYEYKELFHYHVGWFSISLAY